MRHSYTIVSAVFGLLSVPALAEMPGLDALEPGWNRLAPGGDTGCAPGTPFHFSVRHGAEDRLLVFLNGGGACWSAGLCDLETEPSPYVPIADLPHNDPQTLGGVFRLDHPENPLADWSMVFISYCTGDVHLGTRIDGYSGEDGAQITAQHRGRANAMAALDWALGAFDAPERVMVAGSSAGALGAPFFAAMLADAWPEALLIALGDGAGGYRTGPMSVVYDAWGMLDDLPDWPELAEVTSDSFVFDDFWRIARARHPNMVMAQFNNAHDAVQVQFLRLLGIGDPVYPLLNANLDELAQTVPGFTHYLAGGEVHTILRSDNVYAYAQNGERFVDWLATLAGGSAPDMVTCGSAEDCAEEPLP